MTIVQLLVLAVIQGLTEFLPVSSSAHLILGSRLFAWPDQGLVFDVATHLGTLLAVLVYFRAEIAALLQAWGRPAAGRRQTRLRRLGICLLLASVPAIVVGALAHGLVETYLRDVRIIALATIVFGLLLWLADATSRRDRAIADMNIRSAMLIGLAQVFALIPGASRSGVTIMMGRMQGFDADAAARFSFLLAIPVVSAAGAYGLVRMFRDQAPIDWTQFGLAVVASALAGWLCIALFLALLRRIGLVPFIVYRLLLGGILFYLVL